MKTNDNRLLRVGENIRAILSKHIISNELYIKHLNNVIVTITSDDAGVDAHTAQASAVTLDGTITATALTASATADVKVPVTGVTAVANPSNAADTNRMTWIG